MSYNNLFETEKFIKEQQANRELYEMSGMTEQQIHEMYLFDLKSFKESRRYRMHNIESLENLIKQNDFANQHCQVIDPFENDQEITDESIMKNKNLVYLIAEILQANVVRLTEREKYMLFGMASGKSRKKIADELGLGKQSAKVVYSRMLKKLSTLNREVKPSMASY